MTQLSKWWRTPSAQRALKRVQKQKRERFKQLQKIAGERAAQKARELAYIQHRKETEK
jgi:hypothetical protein